MNENFKYATGAGLLAFSLNLLLYSNIVAAACVAFPVAFIIALVFCYAVDGWKAADKKESK